MKGPRQSGGFPERLVARLGKHGYRLAFVAAILVCIPSLGFGFLMDDYSLVLGAEGSNPLVHSPLGLYTFGLGDPKAMAPLIDAGPFPWFTLPELRIEFCRHLSCVTMLLDTKLFGRFLPLFHLHSILWYLILLWAARRICGRTMPGGLGMLAFLVFAVDDGHWLPVTWWANRNALVSVAPALWGVAAHLRWREDGWKPGLPLSLLGYAAGLLAGETALSVLAYLPAYELLGARGPWKARLRGFAPAALLVLVYMALYRAMNFGTYGSEVYVDPGREPLLYLSLAPFRFCSLAGAQFFSILAELPAIVPGTLVPVALLGALSLGVILAGLRAAWPHMEDHERRTLRWLLAGAALSTIPVMSTFPAGRLLLVPSLGGSAAIAVLIRHGWRLRSGEIAPASRPTGKPLRILGGVLVAIHLIVAPLMWPLGTFSLNRISHGAAGAILTAEVNESRLAGQQVMVINSVDPMRAFYPLLVRKYFERPVPEKWRVLSMAPYAHRLTRTGENSFEVEIVNGEMFTSLFEELVRHKRAPFARGDVVHLDGADITVMETGNYGPRRLSCRFEASLESPRYVFLTWREEKFRRLEMPAIGESVLLPRESLFQGRG